MSWKGREVEENGEEMKSILKKVEPDSAGWQTQHLRICGQGCFMTIGGDGSAWSSNAPCNDLMQFTVIGRGVRYTEDDTPWSCS